MKALVTGASGFIACHLLPLLQARGWYVRGAVRRRERLQRVPPGVEGVVVGGLGPETDWSAALSEIDVVVHLAARVHVMRNRAVGEYDQVNVGGSQRLAEKAAEAGVKRLVFVSSVKAMGEASPVGRPWTEKDSCLPEDRYGKSKRNAELALFRIANSTNIQLVVLRPPVVYGPGVGANIYILLRAIDHGWPLPLGSVENRRSFIFVGNFVDAIAKAMEDSRASGETFLVSDGEDVSTPELIRAIARSFGKTARLFPVPPRLLRLAAGAIGRSEEVERLLGSLVVDNSKIRRLLGWQPPFSMEEGLAKTAQWYKDATNHRS
ncbi:MAG: NAD-dependent epimerase/dehydratase family protein [Deltaproteobacteria bacterium]|nr:NAD-dependent epimerase/dehydratase family protein [Deltaproteobacteria bacterium]